MDTPIIVLLLAALLAAAIFFLRSRTPRSTARPPNPVLRRGQPLPNFEVTTDSGDSIDVNTIVGTPAVILFVRGNWCPFCNSQVENLIVHYKEIVDLGARLILVTPKPQKTTQRVAEFFDVDCEFWFDKDLIAARQLGLLHASAVPDGHRDEYGNDTVWPMALVIDSNGTIVYAEQSRTPAERPDAKTLLDELRRVSPASV